MTRPAPPPYGVYAPVVTFFDDKEAIDFDSISQHVRRLCSSGVAGLVVHGSNGEATHLLPEERTAIIRHIRGIISETGSKTSIIAGCSANSVHQTVQYTEDAKAAGADFALVLPPSYWAAAMGKPVLRSFFLDVRTPTHRFSRSFLP